MILEIERNLMKFVQSIGLITEENLKLPKL